MPLPVSSPPDSLTSLPQWVGWRYESREGNSKPTKVPYALNDGGGRASSTDPHCWADYSAAIARGSQFDGIGFVFAAGSGLVGIDLDDCLNDSGTLKSWAAPIAKALSGTYGEVSPSGTGIKFWVRASLPAGAKGAKVYVSSDRKKLKKKPDDCDGAIEIYDSGRYFTVTGQRWGAEEVTELQDVVSRIYQWIAGDSVPSSPAIAQPEDQIVPEGERHEFLKKKAAHLRNIGLGYEAILSALRVTNETHCRPPKPDFELIALARYFARIEADENFVPRGPLRAGPMPEPERAAPVAEPPQKSHADLTAELAERTAAIIESGDITKAYGADYIALCASCGHYEAFDARQALRKKFGKELVLKGSEGAWDVRYQNEVDRQRSVSTAAKSKEPSWRDQLILNDKGGVTPCYENAALFAENSPDWHGVLGYNEFTAGHVILEPGPYPVTAVPGQEIEDHFDTEITRWFERQGVMVKPEVARRTVDRMARLNPFHPVRDYLNGLPPHDGVGRIDRWLFDYCGVSPVRKNRNDRDEPNIFASEAGSRFLISAVARIFEPGCKADHVLVLEGVTGMRKSTLVEILAGKDFFTDQLSDLGSKDSSMQVRGIWIAELAEMQALTRVELEAAKAFITKKFERFRLPYGKRLTRFDRQCVFIGTTESSEWNRDERGARRFWPVLCQGRIKTEEVERDRDQLWAEALKRYRAGERWYLSDNEVVEAAKEEQASRYAVDVWHESVVRIAEDEHALHNRGISASEVLTHLKVPIERQDQMSANRVGRCLRFAKWERRQVRQGEKRVWRFFPTEGIEKGQEELWKS